MPVTHKRLVMVVGGAVLAGAVSLSISTSDASAPPWSGPLPMQHHLDRLAEREVVNDAYYRLTADCMADLGFDYEPTPRVEEHDGLADRYGIHDAHHAATYGYQPAPPRPGYVEELPPESVPSDAFVEALNGPRDDDRVVEVIGPHGKRWGAMYTGGCAMRAEDQLFGGLASYEGLRRWLEDVGNTAWGTAEDAPEVRRAGATWSRCMSDTGYDFDQPHDAVEPWFASTVTDAERRQAVADVRCRETSGYNAILRSADARTQQELLAKVPGGYADWEARWNSAVARAREVVAAPATAG